MRAWICPQCLRVVSDDGRSMVTNSEEAWCSHNGVYHRKNQTIFRVDEESGQPIQEYSKMMEFEPFMVLHYLQNE